MRILKLSLILTILSVPLGQLGKVSGLPDGVGIYTTDVLAIATVGWWLLYSLVAKKSLKITPLGFSILAFAFVAFLSLINGARYLNSPLEFVVSASYWVRWVVYAGIYFVVRDLKESTEGKEEISKAFVVSGVLLALAGFAQLVLFPDWSKFTYLGWDPHKNRLLSTFFDPNFTGIYLVLVINLALSRLLSPLQRAAHGPFNDKERRSNFVAYVALAICGVALILTFSRSAWLAMAVSIFVWGVFKSRKLLLGALVIVFLAYFAVPRIQTRITGGFDPDDSAKLRFQSWSNTLAIAKKYPILGVGFNAFRFAQEREGFFDWREPQGGHSGAGSDSSLLLVLATTGGVGLLSYLSILGGLGFRNLGFVVKGGQVVFSVMRLAVLGALLVDSLFVNSLFYPPVMLFFYLVVV